MTARHRSHLRLAVLALAAACAHPAQQHDTRIGSDPRARNRESVVLSAWKPPHGQKCEVSALPQVLPDPEALVDTAELSLYLRQIGATPQRGYALVSLKFDSTGAPRRVMVIESEVPDTLVRAVEMAVLTALKPQPPGAPLGVRLRIDFTPELVLRVGRSERCEPAIQRAPRGWMSPPPPGVSVTNQVSARWYNLRWEVQVAPNGRALDVRLLDPIDDREMTEHIKEFLVSAEWHPGLDDRVPAEMKTVVTHRVKVTVYVRRG